MNKNTLITMAACLATIVVLAGIVVWAESRLSSSSKAAARQEVETIKQHRDALAAATSRPGVLSQRAESVAGVDSKRPGVEPNLSALGVISKRPGVASKRPPLGVLPNRPGVSANLEGVPSKRPGVQKMATGTNPPALEPSFLEVLHCSKSII